MESVSLNLQQLDPTSREAIVKDQLASLSEEAKVGVLVQLLKLSSVNPLAPQQENLPRQEPQLQKPRPIAVQRAPDYPQGLKKEAVKIAVRMNNNRQAVREIKAKYQEQNLY